MNKFFSFRIKQSPELITNMKYKDYTGSHLLAMDRCFRRCRVAIIVNRMDNRIGEPRTNFDGGSLCSFCTNVLRKKYGATFSSIQRQVGTHWHPSIRINIFSTYSLSTFWWQWQKWLNAQPTPEESWAVVTE